MPFYERPRISSLPDGMNYKIQARETKDIISTTTDHFRNKLFTSVGMRKKPLITYSYLS